MTTNIDKSAYRQQLKSTLSQLSVEQLVRSEAAINQNLSVFLTQYGTTPTSSVGILSYNPHFPGEINLSATLNSISKNQKVFLPVISDLHQMQFYQSTNKQKQGRFGITEPENSESLQPEHFDLIIALIPGLGFDEAGNRLGRGYGFYDRFLAQFPQTTALIKVGIALNIQLLAAIPAESHDQKMDYLLTDTGLKTISPLI